MDALAFSHRDVIICVIPLKNQLKIFFFFTQHRFDKEKGINSGHYALDLSIRTSAT